MLRPPLFRFTPPPEGFATPLGRLPRALLARHTLYRFQSLLTPPYPPRMSSAGYSRHAVAKARHAAAARRRCLVFAFFTIRRIYHA